DFADRGVGPEIGDLVLDDLADFSGADFHYSAFHRSREAIETGTDATVDQLAAQLDDEAAEDGGVDGRGDADIAADTGLEIGGERLQLLGAERMRTRHLGGHLAAVRGDD